MIYRINLPINVRPLISAQYKWYCSPCPTDQKQKANKNSGSNLKKSQRRRNTASREKKYLKKKIRKLIEVISSTVKFFILIMCKINRMLFLSTNVYYANISYTYNSTKVWNITVEELKHIVGLIKQQKFIDFQLSRLLYRHTERKVWYVIWLT